MFVLPGFSFKAQVRFLSVPVVKFLFPVLLFWHDSFRALGCCFKILRFASRDSSRLPPSSLLNAPSDSCSKVPVTGF